MLSSQTLTFITKVLNLESPYFPHDIRNFKTILQIEVFFKALILSKSKTLKLENQNQKGNRKVLFPT